MKRIEELEAEMIKPRSELAKISEEYQRHNASIEELVLKASELTGRCLEVKVANQFRMFN